MCTSTASKPARVERGRHLDLAVDALLAQDRDARPRAASRCTARRCRRAGSNVSCAREARDRVGVERARVLLVGARRVVAQRAASRAWSRDHARVQVARGSSSSVVAAARDRDRALARSARRSRARARRGRARASTARTRVASPRAHLHDRAELLGEQRARARRRRSRRARCRGRSAPANAISQQRRRTGRRRSGRDRRAACRRACSSWIAAKKRAQARGIVEVGRRVAELRRTTCASAEPPRRLRPRAEIDRAAARCRRVERELRRQRAAHVARPARTPTTISDTGAVTLLRARRRRRHARAHRQRVLADRNRDAERRAQLHADRAHRVVQRGVLARLAGGGHPVRRQLDVAERCDRRGGEVGDRLADRHARRRRRVEQRERRALAHRHRLAGVAVEVGERDRAVGDRHLPRADHLVARDQAADGAIADGDRGTSCRRRSGSRSTRYAASRSVDARRGRAAARRARRASTSRVHPRRLAEQHRRAACRPARRAKRAIVARRSCAVVGRVADAPRTGSARARRARRTRASVVGRDREHVALLRLVAPDLAAATCRARRSGSRAGRSARRGRRRATSSGNAFDRPPAPTSWIDRIGLSSPSAQQRSMTSWQRRCDLRRCRAAPRRSRGPRRSRPPPSTTPRRRPGRSASPGRRARQQRRRPAARSSATCGARDVAEAAGDHDRLVVAAHARPLARLAARSVRK